MLVPTISWSLSVILTHKLGEVFNEELGLVSAVIQSRPQHKSLRCWIAKVSQALDTHGAEQGVSDTLSVNVDL